MIMIYNSWILGFWVHDEYVCTTRYGIASASCFQKYTFGYAMNVCVLRDEVLHLRLDRAASKRALFST